MTYAGMENFNFNSEVTVYCSGIDDLKSTMPARLEANL
jgi:hypothetical protein